MSSAIHPSGMASAATTWVAASSANSSATTRSVGSTSSHLLAAAFCRASAATGTPSSSTFELPTGRPLALRKVTAIAPPISSWSARSRNRSMTLTLSVTFAPPMTTTKGRLGSASSASSAATSFSIWKPATVGSTEARPAVVDVRPVRGAEGVVDEEVAETGELLDQARGCSSSRGDRSGSSRAAARHRAACPRPRLPRRDRTAR